MQNNVLIVGNGFDLALGLPTKYSDFAHSDFWPVSEDAEERRRYLQQKKYTSLEAYLNEKRNLETWFDLEQELYNYARERGLGDRTNNENADDIKRNIEYFELLQSRMCDYIKSVQNNFRQMHYDVAREVLSAVVNNGYFNSMYSFNYTELPPLPNHHIIECTHLHGRLKDHSVILGVDDEKKLRNGYDKLIKTSSKFYRSHDLYNALSSSNEVVIFGVSFGDIDYSYFDRFFKGIANGESIKEKDKQYITIFTKDDNSRMAILRQLRKMKIDLQRLYAQSQLQFICTEDDNIQETVNNFKERLDKKSSKNNPLYALI